MSRFRLEQNFIPILLLLLNEVDNINRKVYLFRDCIILRTIMSVTVYEPQ